MRRSSFVCLPRTYLAVALMVTAIFLRPTEIHAQLLGPTPYLSAADSPFTGISFTYFHLENFESGALMVPGVTPSAGTVILPSGVTDSVDADDGVIDGFGRNGHSFFSDGATGIRFTFNASTLGGNLPTHAGIVWTDGTNSIRFEAFDALNNSLGVLIGNHADGNFTGETGEDRFYGIINPGGISSILIQSGVAPGNGGGGIEVDHLQYGFVPAGVPEPTTYLLCGLGMVGAGLAGWRHRSRRKTKKKKNPKAIASRKQDLAGC